MVFAMQLLNVKSICAIGSTGTLRPDKVSESLSCDVFQLQLLTVEAANANGSTCTQLSEKVFPSAFLISCDVC